MAEPKGPFVSKEQENRAYISQKVNPLIENMLMDILKVKPENSVEFMIKWLESKGRKIYDEFIHPKQAFMKGPYEGLSEDSAETDRSEDFPATAIGKKPRLSISEEAYGFYNNYDNFSPTVKKKSPQESANIKEKISKSFIFSELDSSEMDLAVDVFEKKSFQKGAVILNQGKPMDALYLIEAGELDSLQRSAQNPSVDKLIKTYQPGECLGELSLLYSLQSQTTIISKSDCVLFTIDRRSFGFIIKESARRRRKKSEEVLSKVGLLDSLSKEELRKISEVLRPFRLSKGEFVIKEGEKAEIFFIVETGECIASRDGQTVYKYQKGEYFGELALLKGRRHALSIMAETDVSLLGLERASLTRLIGPVEDILKRNFLSSERFVI